MYLPKLIHLNPNCWFPSLHIAHPWIISILVNQTIIQAKQNLILIPVFSSHMISSLCANPICYIFKMYSKPDYFSRALCPIPATTVSHWPTDTAAQLMLLFQLLIPDVVSPSLSNRSNLWVIHCHHVTILLESQFLHTPVKTKSTWLTVAHIAKGIFLATSLMLPLKRCHHVQVPRVSCCSYNKLGGLVSTEQLHVCCSLCCDSSYQQCLFSHAPSHPIGS